MATGLPSLGRIAARVEAQLELQMRHFESLDNKAGIVLGFGGVLVAVAGGTGGFAAVGRVTAVSASLFALWAFLPRNYPVIDTRKLRDRYLRADPEFTDLHLLHTQIAMEERASEVLRKKALRLRISIILLAASILLFAIRILVEGRIS
jgi:hypothetical protein